MVYKSFVEENERNRFRFFFVLGCIFAIGAFLRLYLLSSQILLDDEWHTLNHVVGKTFIDLLTHYNTTDNSSAPFNLYSLALLKTFGLSEYGIRLPAILAGFLGLIIPPLLVRQIFGERVALIFASFLAIAPFLIFYSRFARAYSWVALLCFSALLLAHLWLTTGELKYGTGFVLTAVLAAYMHLLAVIVICSAFITALSCRVFRPSSHQGQPERPAIPVSLKSIVLAAFVSIALLLLLLWPAILQSGHLPWRRGILTWSSILTAATMVSGTEQLALNVLFFSLSVAGQILLFKDTRQLGWIFLSTIGGYCVLLLASRPPGIHRGAVLLRYMIVAVPIALLLASVAMDYLLKRLEKMKGGKFGIPVLGTGTFLICLYATGPLPAIYAAPNDFTNHSAFQGSYKKHTWEHSEALSVYPDFSINQDQIPPFYRWLSGQNIKAIVEYPFDVCDYNDLFYYYQHFHKKRVIAGYCRNRELFGSTAPRQPGEDRFAIGMLYPDGVLSRVTDPRKLVFRNMVDIDDAVALSQCSANVIVLHKYIVALKLMPHRLGTVPVHWNPVDYFRAKFEKTFGSPLYEDEQLVCFRIDAVKE